MKYIDRPLKDYIDDLADKKPAPGGGSVAALTGSLGAGLISMVCNFTIGKEKYKECEDDIKDILSLSENIRAKFSELIDKDVECYREVSAVYKMPKETEENKKLRTEAMQKALKQALQPPFEVCKLSVQAFKSCAVLREKGNQGLISDVYIAEKLLKTAFSSGEDNVEINLAYIKDEEFVKKIREQLKQFKIEIY